MLIYLASPYSHKDSNIRKERYEIALKVTADLISRGFHVFSPITYIHPIVEHLMNSKNETRFTDYYLFKNGEEFDTDMIRHCGFFWILMIDGWEESVGVKAETKLARSLFLHIGYVDIEGNITYDN